MNSNQVCTLLGIEHPIFQGAMAWISDSSLVCAVSEAGGLGVLAAGNAPKDYVRDEIRKIKSKTDRPFAVNIMLLSPYVEDIVDLVIEEDVKIVVTGAGNPGKYMARFKEAEIKVLPVISTVALAKRMESLGCHAVIAEGSEAGGHIGELSTMALVPQVADSVDIPVVAAGGIADNRGYRAATILGASGVQVGTRFLVAHECKVHPSYKQMVIESKDTSAVVTGRSTGHPVRVLKNRLYREYMKLEKSGKSIEELESFGAGKLELAAKQGDVKNGSVMAGQVSGMIIKQESTLSIIEDILGL